MGTTGIGIGTTAHVIALTVDKIGFQQSVDEAWRAGHTLHASRPDPVLQRRIEACLVASSETIMAPVFTVEQLPIHLVLQRLVGDHRAAENIPGAIAGLQRSWQFAETIVVVIVAGGGGEPEHRCYAKGAASEVLLVQRVSTKQRNVAKAGGIALHPAHGRGNVQLFIEKVGDHAKHGEL